MNTIDVEVRPIPGYEGVYSVTADGRIWSHPRTIVAGGCIPVKHIKGRWLKLKPHRGGYVMVTLARDGGVTDLLVHRIVCEVFNGPPPAPGLLARHLDGMKRNNRPCNLAWGTHADNAADAIRLGEQAHGERNGQSKLTTAQVRAILDDPRAQRVVAAEYGIHQVNVSLIKRRKRWTRVLAEFPITLTAPEVAQTDLEET